jgi:hypothetical protein
MIEQLLAVLAVTGIDKGAITDELPEAADYIDGDFEKMAKVGKLASLGLAIATRRSLDNLITTGFTREEAVQIIAGGAMNVKQGG